MLGWEDLAAERGKAINFLRKRCSLSPEDAEDFVGEALYKAYVARADFTGGSLTAWVMFIAINLVRDAKRKRNRRRTEYVADVPEVADPGNPESILIARQTLAMVDYLTEEQQAVIVRAAFGDSFEEISARLGIPIGTVKSRRSRAREALRAVA